MRRIVLWDGYPYMAVRLEDDRGWYIWKVKLNSDVHHVGPHGCTCPSQPKPCKHMQMLAEEPPKSPKRLEPADKRHSRG